MRSVKVGRLPIPCAILGRYLLNMALFENTLPPFLGLNKSAYLIDTRFASSRLGCFIANFVSLCERKDAGLDEGPDGLLDEVRFGFVFKGGLDLVFECLAGGGAGFGGVC